MATPLMTPVMGIRCGFGELCFYMLKRIGFDDLVRLFLSSRQSDRVYLGVLQEAVNAESSHGSSQDLISASFWCFSSFLQTFWKFSWISSHFSKRNMKFLLQEYDKREYDAKVSIFFLQSLTALTMLRTEVIILFLHFVKRIF